jgi:hypothetical protein
MVISRHISNDFGALAGAPVEGQPKIVVHGVQDSPLNGFKAITHVWQGARGDD